MIAKRMLGALFKGFAGAPKLRREGAMVRKWEDMEKLLKGRELAERSKTGGESVN